MKIDVVKIAETKNSTVSKLLIGGDFFCFVVEDGYRAEKVAGETRIPDGVYNVIKRTDGAFCSRYKKNFGHAYALQLENVPGFQFILIHTGNTVEDTRGCLLVADGIAIQKGVFVGVPGLSTPAYLRLYSLIDSAFRVGDPVSIALARDI